jgi:peroxin-19
MDNKAEAILDQALGEFNDGLGGAKAKSSGKKKKGSKKKAEPAGLGGLGLPSKTEKAPPQPKGMGSLGLPAKDKVGAKEGGKGKKKKGGSGAQPAFNPFDPFGAMAGAGGMGGNPYAQMGGGGFGANPYAQADPFADLMPGGGGGMGGGAANPWAANPDAANELAEQMQKMFADFPKPSPEEEADAQKKMQEAIASLSGAGEESGDPAKQEEAMKGFMEAMSQGQKGMQEMMDTMLQQLLSKDVLYEPMVEIAAMYPPWIKKNKKKLPDEEIVRYEAQLAKVKSIIEEFEKPEGEVEFQSIVTLLQEMQSFGQPPEEIMKELQEKKGGGYELPPWMQPGAAGAAGADGMPPGCTVM